MHLQQSRHGETLRVSLRGGWTVEHLSALQRALAGLAPGECRRVQFDGGGLEALDLSAAWLLLRTSREIADAGLDCEFAGFKGDHLVFLDRTVVRAESPGLSAADAFALSDSVASVGRWATARLDSLNSALNFLGRSVSAFGGGLVRPRHLRLPSVVNQIYDAGTRAVPIVALIAFLIAVVIAYMGAQQLRQFGEAFISGNIVPPW